MRRLIVLLCCLYSLPALALSWVDMQQRQASLNASLEGKSSYHAHLARALAAAALDEKADLDLSAAQYMMKQAESYAVQARQEHEQ